eukprot:CAMPEP_0119321360 /NCGR_PEP_ID=MMETSP1333-20130426/55184_1 /TAXON_ID=418940 /ORGANISM="Scyphosphaera apsteinii, Strain RCC1455" /LENGTH=95 /DNA_ID=CAMNT_0007328321 /DNA_START=65 /DNA_END=352 /DNA_ORIENTATION=-
MPMRASYVDDDPVSDTSMILCSNINARFVLPVARSEAAETFGFSGPAESKQWQHHRSKDEMKRFVEKALHLHDARGGMPVVSPPQWKPDSVPRGR